MIELAQEKDVLFLPGCVTPSEILKATGYGLKTVKFFPCEASGGVPVLKLYESAFPNTSFIPTGGITKDNLKSYVECKNVVACDGNFMIRQEMLDSHNSKGIYDIIMECIEMLKK